MPRAGAVRGIRFEFAVPERRTPDRGPQELPPRNHPQRQGGTRSVVVDVVDQAHLQHTRHVREPIDEPVALGLPFEREHE